MSTSRCGSTTAASPPIRPCKKHGQTGQVELFKIHVATPGQVQFSDDCQIIPCKSATPDTDLAFSSFCTKRTQSCKNYPDNLAPESPGKNFARSSPADASNAPCDPPQQASQPVDGPMVKEALSAYSFCNLDARPITAYSHWNSAFIGFGPRRASKYLKVPIFTPSELRCTNPAPE